MQMRTRLCVHMPAHPQIKYGDKWTLQQPPMFAQFRQDWRGLEESWDKANQSDVVISSALGRHPQIQPILTGDRGRIRPAVEALLAPASSATLNLMDAGIADDAQAVQGIQAAVSNLHQLKRELQASLAELKEAVGYLGRLGFALGALAHFILPWRALHACHLCSFTPSCLTTPFSFPSASQ